MTSSDDGMSTIHACIQEKGYLLISQCGSGTEVSIFDCSTMTAIGVCTVSPTKVHDIKRSSKASRTRPENAESVTSQRPALASICSPLLILGQNAAAVAVTLDSFGRLSEFSIDLDADVSSCNENKGVLIGSRSIAVISRSPDTSKSVCSAPKSELIRIYYQRHSQRYGVIHNHVLEIADPAAGAAVATYELMLALPHRLVDSVPSVRLLKASMMIMDDAEEVALLSAFVALSLADGTVEIWLCAGFVSLLAQGAVATVSLTACAILASAPQTADVDGVDAYARCCAFWGSTVACVSSLHSELSMEVLDLRSISSFDLSTSTWCLTTESISCTTISLSHLFVTNALDLRSMQWTDDVSLSLTIHTKSDHHAADAAVIHIYIAGAIHRIELTAQ